MKDFILKYYRSKGKYAVTLVVKGMEVITFDINDITAYHLEQLGVKSEYIK